MKKAEKKDMANHKHLVPAFSFSRGLGRLLFFWFLVISLLPLLLVSYASTRNAQKYLEARVEKLLTAITESKAREITAYFNNIITILVVEARSDDIRRMMEDFNLSFAASGLELHDFIKSEEWAKLTDHYGKDRGFYHSIHGLHDILLINPEGNILFTVQKYGDLGTNIFSGPYTGTRFSEVCRKALASDQLAFFSDLGMYSTAQREGASFVVARITDDLGSPLGLFAIRIPQQQIDAIMKQKSGLGDKGETFLLGADLRMRSNSNLDFKENVLTAPVENELTARWFHEDILERKEGGRNERIMILDRGRRGVPVLAAYAGLTILGIPMAVIAEVETSQAFAQIIEQREITLVLVLGTVLFVIFVSNLVAVRIVRPVRNLSDGAKRAAGGDYSQKIAIQSGGEIGELADSFNNMLSNLQRASEENERNNWLNAGRTGLADQMRGDKNIRTLAKDAIGFLARYVNAQVGTFYVLEEDGRFHLSGSYSLRRRKSLLSEISPGEGLAGQAAMEKEYILVTEIPQDYIHIDSSLGHSPPRNLLAMPVLMENKVKGVFELGSFHEFMDIEIEFLQLVSENIAIAVHAAMEADNTRKLLEKSQTLTEELQAQQEELRESNERLHSQQEELRITNEQLQAQEEELRVSNEELEEKTKSLELQKKEIEINNLELESARENLSRKARELEQASKYKSEFLANMSHELRTPLNSLLLIANKMAKNKDGRLSDKQVKALEIICGSGNTLLNLINEILDLAKIEAGRIDITMEDVGLASIKSSMENLFGQSCEEKGLSFQVNINPSLPQTIHTDRYRLEQILRNLLANAIKFTERGGITLSMEKPDEGMDVSASGLPPGRAVAFKVTDTGIGIPKDKQAIIFEAFQQADGSTSRKFGGTGLGLSITRELTKLLGGEIHLKSNPETGSTFTVIIPSEPEPGAKAVHCDKAAAKIGQSLPRTREDQKEYAYSIHDDREHITSSDKVVLVIEDDVNFAEILYDICHEKGFKCLHAAAGEKGLVLAEEHRPHAIILDLGLPGMQGWQVLDMLKNNINTRHIPVHIISASEKHVDILRRGAIGHLTKPVTDEQLDQVFDYIKGLISRDIKELLIVEDDENLRTGMEQLLESKNIRITSVGEGGRALELLGARNFDCMILDLRLPDISGFQVLRQMAAMKEHHTPPVIIYTGKDLSKKEQYELDKYADSVVIKGVKSDERLVDETTLFLHTVVEEMGKKGRHKLGELYDVYSCMKNKKVLLVDDDMRNLFALSDELEEINMIVVKATNGDEALLALEEHPDVDIVLMDIMMPVMDGYEAMEKIRKQARFHDLPILALTAKAMREDRDKCIKAGANDYLPKPVDYDRLMSTMRVWLKR